MKKKGFTLIELLTVIAIIGILASVVTASLGSARQKARDTKRISDIKTLQLALAMYADANDNHYPATLSLGSDPAVNIAPIYIPAIPVPPTGGSYSYAALASVAGGTPCISYHLGAVLETNSSVLQDDSDAAAGFGCGSAIDFSGADTGGTNVCGITGATVNCFDVKP